MSSRDDVQVVVSLASVPRRVHGLKQIIDCLKEQTLQPDRIHLWMCPYYERLDQTFSLDQLPDWLADTKVETALVQDRGPVTKLYPAIEKYADTNTVIVTMDDDRTVPRYFLETLVESALELKAVCGSQGRLLSRPNYDYSGSSAYGHGKWCVPWPEDRRAVAVDILLGTGGIAYPPGTLTRDFLGFLSGYLGEHEILVRMCDDIWINGFLALRNIQRFAVYTEDAPGKAENEKTDALWPINKHYDFNTQSINLFRFAW